MLGIAKILRGWEITGMSQWLLDEEAFARKVREFEKRFTGVSYCDLFLAPTGEEFAVLSVSEKSEGKFYWTSEEAIDALMKALDSHASLHESGCHLYWRIRPEIDYIIDSGAPVWRGYARFLISSKPKLSGAEYTAALKGGPAPQPVQGFGI